MRKIIRSIIRNEGERKNVKPSKWVNRKFNRLQGKKCGEKRRLINQAKGTHKRREWKQRILMLVRGVDNGKREA